MVSTILTGCYKLCGKLYIPFQGTIKYFFVELAYNDKLLPTNLVLQAKVCKRISGYGNWNGFKHQPGPCIMYVNEAITQIYNTSHINTSIYG